MTIRSLFLVSCLFISYPSFSQFMVSAELRPRVIVSEGYGKPILKQDPPTVWVTQRTRVSASFKNESLQAYVSIQEARIWGGDDHYNEGGTFGNKSNLRLFQGWFRLDPAPWLSLTAGRQLLSYDDQRIIASRDWNDNQVVYDAVLMQAIRGSSQFDLGVSWNAESAATFYIPPVKFKTFDFIRFQWKNEYITWSAISLLTGNTVSDTINRIWFRETWGSNLTLSGKGLQFKGSVYYQHHLNDVGGKVSAYCVSVQAGGQVIPKWLEVVAGADLVSGQDDLKQDPGYLEKEHAFDLFYGRRHALYGYMDYFSTMPAQGLQDYMLKATCTLTPAVSLYADYHFFRLAASALDPDVPGQALNKNLGSELDLTIKWKLSDQARLQAGYSFYITAPTLLVIEGMPVNECRFPQFLYVMVTLTPSFKF
jgi:hypothetical protein